MTTVRPEPVLPAKLAWRIAASDHLVIATGTSDRRCLGVIAASDMATDREPFLFLDAAYLAPMARASDLLQRMLAFAVLRVAGSAAVPAIIAKPVQTCRAFSVHCAGIRRSAFTMASLFPAAPDAVVIDLGMASLARRIMRVVRPASRHSAATNRSCSTGGTGYTSFPISRPVGLASGNVSSIVKHGADGSRCRKSPGLAGGSAGNVVTGSASGVTYGTAGAIQRTGETLIVLDLSMADDATILEEARKLYRTRPRKGTRRTLVDPVGGDALQSRRRLPGTTAR